MKRLPRPGQHGSSTRYPSDPATKYALDVTEGRIIAGPYVRAACKRHLVDLDNRKVSGLQWDVAEVRRVVDFFYEVLTVEIEEIDEDGETTSKAVPFDLAPWECFIVGSLFGWKTALGLRRFRRAYIEIAKGNGKSPLAAGIGHYMLTATKKLRAEIYSAATDKDQAAILFRDAVSMWKRSPELYKRLTPKGDVAVWELVHRGTDSFFKPIASEKKSKSGIRPYCGLIDEVHEHPNNDVIEMMRAGTKGNRQALIFEITNSGFDTQSVCWKEHEYTIKVVTGVATNQSWFGYIASLDDGDDPFEDETCWIKPNPNLGVSIHPEFIREQVEEAKGMPSKENLVRRLHFCEWTDAAKTWISRPLWEKLCAPFDIMDYRGMDCGMGLDMSYVQDLSALAYAFPTGEDSFDAFIDYWTPRDTMIERAKQDGVDYPLWVKQGHLFAPEGKVIKLDSIALRIGWAMDNFNLIALAYDAYRHRELDVELEDLDIKPPLVEHPQGFRRAGKLPFPEYQDKEGKPLDNPLWMPESVEFAEASIIENRLRVKWNPVSNWNVSCVVIRDDPSGAGNRVFDKRKATGRIDGMVALVMAIAACKLKALKKERKSIFQLRAERAKAEGAAKPADPQPAQESVPVPQLQVRTRGGPIDFDILKDPKHPLFFKMRERYEATLSDDED